MLISETLSVLSDTELDAVAGGVAAGYSYSNTVLNIVELSVGNVVANNHSSIGFNVITSAYGGSVGGGGRGHKH